jgi:hypothetical protein
MNLALNAGMNQMKDQAQNLIEAEMQDKSAKDSKGENIEINNKGNQQKKQKKVIKKIDRNLTVRMYSVLLFHTLSITILLLIIHLKGIDIEGKINDQIPDESEGYMPWLIFAGCIVISIILSLLVSKVKCISKIYFNYIFYIILLALNCVAFVWGGKDDDLFQYILSMLIMFDAGSLSVLMFSLFVKDIPSTFWIMLSCSGGLLIAMFVLIKVFNDHKYFVLLSCVISFAIYEVMNYNALDVYKSNANNTTSIPSMMSLPFELNLSFLKLVYYLFYGLFYWFKACCCPSRKKR